MVMIAASARLAALIMLLTATHSGVAAAEPAFSGAPSSGAPIASAAAIDTESKVTTVTHWQANYCTDPPVTIVLDYKGPLREYRGRLCYGFAGYSETCFIPESRWLTPASRWRLPGPGQIPLDLLSGYTLLIRLPEVEEQAVAMQPGRCS